MIIFCIGKAVGGYGTKLGDDNPQQCSYDTVSKFVDLIDTSNKRRQIQSAAKINRSRSKSGAERDKVMSESLDAVPYEDAT